MHENLDGDRNRFFKDLVLKLHAFTSGVARLEKPVIGAVNGVAAGAGFSMVLSCDIVIASDKAKFTMAYTRLGVIPDGGSTYFLSRVVGVRRALDLALTNRLLSPEEACELGIVSRVVPDADFIAEVDALAGQLAKGPTMALGKTKRLIYEGMETSLETQLENERHAISAISGSEDSHEGVLAFVGKRPPQFKGK
jgi:2-(1,2-epoxy-1,2-dihydrophenyl)acetyl-CoA isomerase